MPEPPGGGGYPQRRQFDPSGTRGPETPGVTGSPTTRSGETLPLRRQYGDKNSSGVPIELDPVDPYTPPDGTVTPVAPPIIPAPGILVAPGEYGSQAVISAKGGRLPVCYGTVLAGGEIIHVKNGGGDISVAIAYSEGEIEEITSFYDPPFSIATSQESLLFYDLDRYLGTLTQSADADVGSTLGKLPGVAYCKFRFLDSYGYQSRLYFPAALVKGRKPYDPREQRLTYSESGLATQWTFSSAPTIAATANEWGYTGSQASAAAAAGAFRWTFPGSGGTFTASRTTSGLGLTTADPLIVHCKARVTSGTATISMAAVKVTGSETTTTSCALTTSWKEFTAVVAAGGGGSGEGRILFSGIANSAVIEIDEVSIEVNSEHWGYTKTAAAAITPGSRYSANPALAFADLKRHDVYGMAAGMAGDFAGTGLNDLVPSWDWSTGRHTYQFEVTATGTYKWRVDGGSYTTGVSMTTSLVAIGSHGLSVRWGHTTGYTVGDVITVQLPNTTRIDWGSVGRAACYCDQVQSEGAARYAIGLQLREPDTAWKWEATIGLHFGGRWQMSEGLWTIVVNRASTTVVQVLTTNEIIGSPRLKRGQGAGAVDLPNRVTVEWIDANDLWRTRTTSVNGPDIEQGKPVREGQPYRLHGCLTEAQAYRHAWYLLNAMNADLSISVDVTPDMLHLRPGDRFQVTDASVGLSAFDFYVTSIARKDDGTLTVEGLEYYDVWSPGAYTTNSLVLDTAVSLLQSPPDIVMPQGSNNPGKVWWNAPEMYNTPTLYGASYWSFTNAGTNADAAHINDGTTNATHAWSWDQASDATAVLDLGSGQSATFRKMYVLTSGTPPAVPVVEYSDDGAAWTAPTQTSYRVYTQPAGTPVAGVIIEWAAAGAHRYWRVRKGYTTSTSSGSFWIFDLQFYTSAGVFPYVRELEIRQGSGNSSNSPVLKVIPVLESPTSSIPFTVENESRSEVSGNVLVQYGLYIVVVSITGARSTGVMFNQSTSFAPSTFTDTTVARMAAPADAQPGGIWLGGGVKAAGLTSTPSGTGAGQTGQMALRELAANGASETGFKAPDSLAGDVIYTLPTTDGAVFAALVTNGGKVLSWLPVVWLSGPGTQTGSIAITGTVVCGDLNTGAIVAESLQLSDALISAAAAWPGTSVGQGVMVYDTSDDRWKASESTRSVEPLLPPPGEISLWSTGTAPTGWVLCDGASYLRAGSMARLFAVIGTTFGAVDGTHFNVPTIADPATNVHYIIRT